MYRRDDRLVSIHAPTWGATPNEDFDFYNTSVRTIERCIAELRKQGKIQYDGSKRFGGYRVVEQREDGRDASAS